MVGLLGMCGGVALWSCPPSSQVRGNVPSFVGAGVAPVNGAFRELGMCWRWHDRGLQQERETSYLVSVTSSFTLMEAPRVNGLSKKDPTPQATSRHQGILRHAVPAPTLCCPCTADPIVPGCKCRNLIWSHSRWRCVWFFSPHRSIDHLKSCSGYFGNIYYDFNYLNAVTLKLHS